MERTKTVRRIRPPNSSTKNFIDFDFLSLALHFDRSERFYIVSALQPFTGRIAENNVRIVLLIQGFQTRSKIDIVSDDRVAQRLLGADISYDHFTGVNADADIEGNFSLRC